ncbi:MAG TPA: ATP-binding protein [Stellaceae bacterium]|nr:ATP-binding protein [Stellaceae bacterium]
MRSAYRLRILVVAAVLIVVGVIGLAAWMIVDSRRAAWNHAVQSEENLLTALENGANRNIELYDLSLRTLRDGLKLPEIWTISEPLRQQVLFDGALAARHLGGMVATDEHGNIIASSVPNPSADINYADRDYFVAHRDHADLGLVVTGPMRSKLSGAWALAFSRRIDHDDGSFAGVVVGTMKLTLFKQLFDSLDLGDGRVGLVHREGRLILRHPYDDSDVGRDTRAGQLAAHMAKSRSGHYEAESILDGGTHLYTYRQLGDLPLYLFVRTPVESVLAEWRQKAIAIGAAVFGLAALAALLGLALAAELSRRGRAEVAAIEGERRLVAAKEQAERARAEAEAASRVKSEFLATMSHELRTPLNAIIGFSEIIRDALMAPVDSRYRDYARDIHESGHHLLRLINDVLDLSKVEVGRLELHNEPVAIGDLLQECLRLVGDRARKASVELAVEAPVDVPMVLADALRLKQIVLNLLSNAVKFTPAGGWVKVSATRSADGSVSITVADNGIGMTPDDIPRALEPFRQLDSRLARRFEGTGLGLPLAKTLTELHRGTLTIESAVGVGTAVTVSLPADRSLSMRQMRPAPRRQTAVS